MLMLPFFEGTGGNGWLGQQTLGQANHGGELQPPEWLNDWEEQRLRAVAWMAWQGG